MSGEVNYQSYVVEIIDTMDMSAENVTQIQNWTKLQVGSFLQQEWNDSAMNAYTSVGLFEFDLSSFQAGCQVSMYCNDELYATYDGSGVG